MSSLPYIYIYIYIYEEDKNRKQGPTSLDEWA